MFTRVHDVEQMFKALNLYGMGRECADGGHQRDVDAQSSSTPLTNIYDYGDALLFQAEIPGVAKDELTIELQGKHLEIKVESKRLAPEGYSVHRQGRCGSGFSRSYTLPMEVAGERVTSSLENGILTLTLPKAEKAKKREITIQ